jgi:hypothetical protein
VEKESISYSEENIYTILLTVIRLKEMVILLSSYKN